MQVIQEMYHGFGTRFSSLVEVQQKIRSLQNYWTTALSPAIVKFATESGVHQLESDDLNGKKI